VLEVEDATGSGILRCRLRLNDLQDAKNDMSRRVGKKGANWSVERRYEFMEFRLYWQGNIKRSNLMEAFGSSVQQASKDFANYIEGRKSNLTCDKSRQT
jgi:hypothetical protein